MKEHDQRYTRLQQGQGKIIKHNLLHFGHCPNADIISIGQSTNSKGACIPTYEIPSVLKGRDGKHSLNALGDTCAIHNFMSPKCAVSLGLNVKPTTSELVAIGSGARVKTTGVVATWYRFRDEPEKSYPLLFHILPNSVQDIILGRTFLKVTETFTCTINRLRRVKKTVLKTLKQHRLLYLGDRAPKFLGLLNGTFVDALADTGSNVLVMDEDFARERGLFVVRGREHRTRLMFADGTTKMTSGVTRKMSWQFGASPDSPKHLLEFHVLKNSPTPVILNDSLLFDTNAYEAYDRYLVDEEYDSESDEEEAYLFHIGYDFSYDAQGEFTKKFECRPKTTSDMRQARWTRILSKTRSTRNKSAAIALTTNFRT